MKLIYTHDNIVVLHSVKNILSLNNIESFVKNEHVIPNSARHGIDNTFLELWAYRDRDYEKATAIIESEVENPVPAESWCCAECNEENEGSFDFCWSCQHARPNA